MGILVTEARANVSQDVKKIDTVPRPQLPATHPQTPKVRVSRCDVSFEKLEELLRLGALEPSHSDQGCPLWLIDVREKHEVARDGKIPKSVNLPLGSLKKALLADCEDFDVSYGFPKPEKHNENVIFYSNANVKSAMAVEIAHRLGYSKSRHYSGGYEEWITKQMPHIRFNIYQED